MHPSFKANVEAETADSAYYGYLAKIQSQVVDYFLKGTEEQFNKAIAAAKSGNF